MQRGKRKISNPAAKNKEVDNRNILPSDFIQLFSENFFNILLNSSDIMIILNPNGNIVFVNETGLKIWGRRPPKGYTFFNESENREKIFPILYDEIKQKKRFSFQHQFEFNPSWLHPPGPDKLYFFDQEVIGIYQNEELKYFLLKIKDITENHRLEQELIGQKRDLEKSNQELKEIKQNLEKEVQLRANKALKKELDLQYSNVISMISTTFLSGTQIEERMQSALRTLVEVSGYSFASIIQNTGKPNEKYFSNIWSWNIPSLNINIHQFSTEIYDLDMDINQLITPENNHIVFHHNDAPDLFKKILKKYHISSILIVPIIADNTFTGIIIIGNINKRNFIPREISMALQTAIIIGLALKNQKIQIEDKLKHNEALLQGISNNITSGMLYQVIRSINGQRKFTYLSDSVRKLYGISPAEGMVNSNLIYSRVFPEDLKKVIKEEEKANQTLSVFKTVVRVRNPDGSTRWSSFISNPQKLPDGSTLWNGVEMDITELIQIENALRESENRFHTLIDQMGDGFELLDKDGKYIEVNKAMCNMVGYSEEELLNLTVQDIDTEYTIEKYKIEYKKLLRTESKTYYSKFVRKDKIIIPVEITAKCIMLKGEYYISCTIREKK